MWDARSKENITDSKLHNQCLCRVLKMNSTPKKTPRYLSASPGLDLTSDGELLTEDEIKMCRSGVGKLLFLMRYSRPDMLNIVRDLSRWMTHRTNVDHMKVLKNYELPNSHQESRIDHQP